MNAKEFQSVFLPSYPLGKGVGAGQISPRQILGHQEVLGKNPDTPHKYQRCQVCNAYLTDLIGVHQNT